MESSARSGGSATGKKSRWLWWFLGGLVLGIIGTIFVPDLVRPYLPDMLKGENVEIAGVVEAKSREADRLLLTIGGDAGAVLVTYTQEIPEMDLLIEPGDSVVLAVREYAPFVEDPSVRRVQKGGAVQRRQPAREQAEPPPSEIERRNAPPRPDAADEVPSDTEFRREIGPIVDSLRAPSEEGEELRGTERSPSSDSEGQETEAQDPQ
jgi:hypothetical protein